MRENARLEKEYDIDDASYLMGYSEMSVLPYDKYISPIYLIDKNKMVKDITDVDHQMISQYLDKESKKYHFYAL